MIVASNINYSESNDPNSLDEIEKLELIHLGSYSGKEFEGVR